MDQRFIFRNIRPEEAVEAANMEEICFPPNEACSRESMAWRVEGAPELFLVAQDRETGCLAGFLNGVATDETVFRDEFFTQKDLISSQGSHVMLLGLDVLPAYRHQGLATEIVRRYAQRERENGRKALVLTCLEGKVKMYQGMGFRDLGAANSTWGGEAWHEMVMEL